MSVTVPLRRNRSTRLLGTPTEALSLAIRGGEHDGCVIRIRAAKCTVGSAPGCTLRLRSPGVSPLACWILRGPGGTVVRRRASDLQLNGRGFRDAPLSPGDRLRIGPVELEILGCPVAPREAFFASPLPEFDPPSTRLEQEACESGEATARLREQLAQLQSELDAQRRQAATAGNASAQMTITMDQIRQAQDEQANLLRERDELQSEHKTLRTSFADLTKQLHEAQTAQQQLDETGGQVEQLQALSQAQQARLEELERQLVEARSQEAGSRGQETGDRSQEALRQLTGEREQLDTECEQLLAGQQELAALREQLELAQATFADERRQVVELAQAKEQLLNRQAEELSDRLERVAGRQSELDARQQELAEQESQLRARLAQLQDQQYELDERKAALDGQALQLAESHNRLEQSASEIPLEPVQAGEQVREEFSEPPVAAAEEAPAAQPHDSQNVESVLSRLVQAGLWRGGKDDAASPAQAESSPVEQPVSEVAAEQPVAELTRDSSYVQEVAESEEPAAAKPVWSERPAAAAAGNDESIESYMDRLLKRVRGESGGAPEKPATRYAPPTPAPQQAPAPLPEVKPVAAVEPVKAEDYIPRSQAPEQGVNLAAMRALANSAARSAIQTHAQHRGNKQAKGKLVGAAACVAVAGVAAVIALQGGSWTLAGGALLALLAAGYCGLDGLQHALGALKLGRPQGTAAKDIVAEETRAEESAEAHS